MSYLLSRLAAQAFGVPSLTLLPGGTASLWACPACPACTSCQPCDPKNPLSDEQQLGTPTDASNYTLEIC
jgi:hypothetical protein